MLVEKLMSGLYMGECAQRLLLSFARHANLFGGHVPAKLSEHGSFVTAGARAFGTADLRSTVPVWQGGLYGPGVADTCPQLLSTKRSGSATAAVVRCWVVMGTQANRGKVLRARLARHTQHVRIGARQATCALCVLCRPV
jgi:hypothetical protein